MAQEEDIKQNIILDYKTNAGETAKEIGVLSDTTEQVTTAKQKDTKATKENDVAYKSMRTQVKEATQEMYRLQEQYGLTSKEAIEATKKVAGLKDQMADAKNIVEGFNPDRKFQGLATAVNAAAVAASGITSGMALFGAESEETEKALLKVQAAMAFSDAVGRITEMGDDFTKLKAQVTAMFTTLTTAKTVDTTVTEANNASKSKGIVIEEAGAVATVAKTGALSASTIATTAATVATNIFNASMAIALAPITLIIAGIAGLVAGIGYLTGAFGDFSGEQAKAEKANKTLGKEIDNLSKSSKKQAEATEISQYQTLAMAKASGASAKEIRKLSEELINQEVAEKRVNAVKAYSIYLEAKRVAGLEDATDAEKARLKESIESYNNLNGAYKDSVKEKNKLIFDNKTAEIQEATDRQKEIEKKQAEHLKQLAEQRRQANEIAKKERERIAKEQADADAKSLKDAQDIIDQLRDNKETPAQKEEREYLAKKAILEKNHFDTEELTKQHNERMAQISLDNQASMLAELEFDAEGQIAIDKKTSEDKKLIEEALLEQKKQIQEKSFEIAEKGIQLVSSVFGKSKAIQKAAIIAENAVGIGKMIIANNTANVAALATPQAIASSGASAVPVIALNNISTGIGVASTIAATAKALQAVGGGGSVSSGGGSTPATPSGGSVPQVGFQNSGENQIASTINQNQQAQPPIQAFVVSSEVTTAQALDRNKINANSLGG
jgi:hypothetical protein